MPCITSAEFKKNTTKTQSMLSVCVSSSESSSSSAACALWMLLATLHLLHISLLTSYDDRHAAKLAPPQLGSMPPIRKLGQVSAAANASNRNPADPLQV